MATDEATAQQGPELGPLGPGHTPVKDPLKGLRGVMAGTLSMEAISLLLVLTVIARIDEGAYWTTFNWVYVAVVGGGMFVLAFLMKQKWAMPVNWVLQGLALLGGLVVHPSMGVVAIIFILVWAYVMYLRSVLLDRMRRGLLTTQHS